VNLLVGENLPSRLVQLLPENGIPAAHVAHQLSKRTDVAPRPRCVRELLVSGSYPSG
jgi:hypothetical protein